MKRISEIDIAKAIGIFCLLVGHRTGGIIQNYVYLFHMPLFLILSGIVMNDDNGIFSENKLLSSYIVYSLIFILFGNFAYYGKNLSIKIFISTIYQTLCFYGVHALWFLSSLWLGKLLVKQAIKIDNKRKELLIIFGIYAVSFFISKIVVNISYDTLILKLLKYVIYSFVRVGVISIFILIGYLFKNNIIQIINFFKKRNTLNIVVCLAISLILIPFLYFGGVDYHLLYNGIFFFDIVYGCLGTLLVILISILINKTLFNKCFIKIGQNSLFLMATEYFRISGYTKKMLSFIPEPYLDYVSIMAYAIILLILTAYLPPLINNLIDKVKNIIDRKAKLFIR